MQIGNISWRSTEPCRKDLMLFAFDSVGAIQMRILWINALLIPFMNFVSRAALHFGQASNNVTISDQTVVSSKGNMILSCFEYLSFFSSSLFTIDIDKSPGGGVILLWLEYWDGRTVSQVWIGMELTGRGNESTSPSKASPWREDEWKGRGPGSQLSWWKHH